MATDLLRLPDGRQAQYWRGGAEHGPTVFFLHGCPDTRHAAYAGEAAARSTGVRLVAVNRPGYGLSDAAESGHLSVADDVAAVADLLDIERYAVLGMSIGGPVRARLRGASPATGHGYLRDAAISFRSWDFRPEKVSCPSTFWYGELDSNASVRNGEWFAANVPGAKLVVREGASHLGALHNHWEDILSTLRD